MRLSDERLAQFAAAVARVGETRARSGLKALTLTLRYKSPIRDARDCEDLLNAIHNLPHILAEVRALRECEQFAENMAEHDCAYGDNCPTFGSRHGRCTGCAARAALAAVRALEDKP